jgi:hypothetical protein
LKNAVDEVAKPGAVAAAPTRFFAGGAAPVEREMRHQLEPGVVGRRAALVIPSAGAAHLTHDHRLESRARTLAAASAPASDGAPALSAQSAKRSDELLVIGRVSPCEEPSGQALGRIENIHLDGFSRKQTRDYDPRTAAYIFDGSPREFSEFFSQHLGGRLVEMAPLPERSQPVMCLAKFAFDGCVAK